MTSYVELDNLPKTSNYLLNILWEQNHEMTLDELTDTVNQKFSLNWDKTNVRCFLMQLIAADYVEARRHGLTQCYAALGADTRSE